jgi:hypothetical protein
MFGTAVLLKGQDVSTKKGNRIKGCENESYCYECHLVTEPEEYVTVSLEDKK